MATHETLLRRDMRREQVARLMTENPGISVRDLRAKITRLRVPDPGSGKKKLRVGINLQTGKPFSLGTIAEDVMWLKTSGPSDELNADEAKELYKDYRQQLITGLLARNRRITMRQIQAQLAMQNIPDPLDSETDRNKKRHYRPGINPQTKRPWSKTTITSDVEEIRADWTDRKNRAKEVWLVEELMALDELQQQCWAGRSFRLVLECKKLRRLLLGYGHGEDITLDFKSRQELEEEMKRLDTMGTDELDAAIHRHLGPDTGGR